MKKVDLFNIPWMMISIDDRRLLREKELFRKFGLKEPNKFTGFTFKNLKGAENIVLANLALVKMAKSLNYDAIFIFEDDAYPCDGIKEELESIQEVPDDCIILNFGWIYNKNTFGNGSSKFVIPHGKNQYGEHSYVIFKDGYEKYEKYFSSTKTNADWIFWHPIPGIYNYYKNLFVQYNNEESNSGHYGYIYEDGLGHNDPPPGFSKIENILK